MILRFFYDLFMDQIVVYSNALICILKPIPVCMKISLTISVDKELMQ